MPTQNSAASEQALDAASGAVLGALAGDAAGAVLEMLGRAPTDAEVENALSFPGGGCWRVAPGQVTDDGELTVSLLRTLAEQGRYDEDRVANGYGDWLRSHPFDVGNATSAGLGPALDRSSGETAGLAAAMRAAARAHSAESKANGSLMRCTPLGVLGSRMENEEIVRIAFADSSLTHPNRSCCDAVAAYSLAIAHLVRRPGDRAGAFELAFTWARGQAGDDVKAWLDAAALNKRPEYFPQVGFVRIGLTEAFRHLLLGSDWRTAIRETLLGGGDTDTNACIVGGLVGASTGARSIPREAVEAVLSSDHARGRRRPEFVHPRDSTELVERVMGLTAPDTVR